MPDHNPDRFDRFRQDARVLLDTKGLDGLQSAQDVNAAAAAVAREYLRTAFRRCGVLAASLPASGRLDSMDLDAARSVATALRLDEDAQTRLAAFAQVP